MLACNDSAHIHTHTLSCYGTGTPFASHALGSVPAITIVIPCDRMLSIEKLSRGALLRYRGLQPNKVKVKVQGVSPVW